MELKLTELASVIEDAFCYSLPEERLAGVETAGDLYDMVLAQRFRGNRQGCLNSITFCQIRRALASVLKIPQSNLQKGTPLAAIIPRRRRRTWRALQAATGYRLPQLCRPYWLVLSAWFFTVGMAIAVPLSLSLTLLNGAVLAALLTTGVVGCSLAWLTIPFAYEFEPDCTTVGELTAATLAHNYRKIANAANLAANESEVWNTLRVQIAGRFGATADDITEKTVLASDSNARRLWRLAPEPTEVLHL